MDAQQLKLIFERPYNRADWYNISKEIFGADKLLAKPAAIKLPDNEWGAVGLELGNFETTDGRLIGLYELEINKKAQLHRNRKGLKDLLAKVYKENVDAALIVFVQGNKWRFSYVSEIYTRNSETGKREKKTTDPKRFTYLLGEGERCKTAADRFSRIKQSSNLFAKGVTLEALEEAFNVEKMSKAFFNEYRKHYGAFTAFLTGKNEDGKEVRKSHAFLRSIFNGDEKDARDFVKKLLGRIVFLYFLQKKGWLGVPENGKWGEGNEDFLHQLFLDYKEHQGFYANVLAPLFFETLNTERDGDLFKIKPSLFSKAGYNKLKIPYLNGGLFDDDEPETDVLDFPRELFEKLFLFFDQYNFTVYEDSPDEHTVAVDPEMLGHIFENLLEDNKDKGAYYTPKEIVHYMCRESLIEYLYTKLNPQEQKEQVRREAIEKFIKNHEAADIIDWDENILKALREVKVCDPAIGSGAFPMGILMEIFHAVETLFYANPDTVNAIWKLGNDNQNFNAAKVKESIIQNSIYGVDIEKGAVDIARLRFWLSLVVDENKPKPLPNLDYKIVVGNSLLSKFEDEVIDIDWDMNTARATEATRLVITQQASKLNTLQAWQTAYFHEKREKTKQQLEIRNIKIDILINQLTLSKIFFQQKNPKLGGFAPTAKEIQKNLENELVVAGYDKTVKKLEALKKNKKAVLEFFDWKLDFPEVMNEKVNKGEVGFDIVIGNPPYLRVQGLREKYPLETEHYIEKYEAATGRFDLFTLFSEKGFRLLNKKGVLNFIQPDKWVNSDFGVGMRKLFRKNVKKLISFGQNQVFNVSTYSSLIWITANQVKHLKYFQLDKELENEQKIEWFLNNLKEENFELQNIESLQEQPWVLLTGNSSSVIKTISQSSLKLKDVVSNISQGVVSVGDDIFIMEGNFKGKYFIGYSEKIKEEVSIEAELMRPLLKGDDVKKYEPLNPFYYIIYPHFEKNGKTIPYEEVEFKKKFPKAYTYFLPFKKELTAKKIKYKTNPKYWYSLHRSREISLFEREKIITPEISFGTNMTFDNGNLYHNTKCYSLVIDLEKTDLSIKFLLGILNSKIMWYYLSNTGYVLRGGFFTFKTQYLESFPLPESISTFDQKHLVRIVDKILTAKKTSSKIDTTELEKKIDTLTYKLYGLTYQQACAIEEGGEWLTKEEYENFSLEEHAISNS